MKKIYSLIIAIILAHNCSFSQVDFKGGLFASLPYGFFAAGEYELYENLGLELGVVSNLGTTIDQTYLSGTAILLNARYYFSPRYGLDRFYAGVYVRPHTTVIKEEFNNFSFSTFPTTGSVVPTSSNFELSRDSGVGIGILIGKKFVDKNKYFLDLNVGLGRNLGRRVYDIDRVSTPFTFGRQSDRISIDFFYSLVIGYRL